MDVNGTRFHLIAGRDDWERCLPAGRSVDAAWDARRRSLTLRPLASGTGGRARRPVPWRTEARRGAAFDRFGNRYWIGRDRQTIWWRPSGGNRNVPFWTPNLDAPSAPLGSFTPDSRPLTADALAGLAVAKSHHLVVGDISQHGLLVFDLHRGGAPWLLEMPTEFEPFVVTPAPEGGVWILDRAHRTIWGVDVNFRPIGLDGGPIADPPFLPDPGGDLGACGRADTIAKAMPPTPPAHGFLTAAIDPIAIVALRDRRVLILESPAMGGSRLHLERLGSPVAPVIALPPLEGLEAGEAPQPVSGHAMAYLAESRTLLVAERDGYSAIAFDVDFEESKSPRTPITIRPDDLPLQSFGGRALVVRAGRAYHDVGLADVGSGSDPSGSDRVIQWVELRERDESRYTRAAILTPPIMDGKESGCVWHRLLIDACIPNGTKVIVASRAANDPALLDSLPFQPEPALYLRGNGPELPHYDPYPESCRTEEGLGTWELLFQSAQGRYLEISLELRGDGRATPALRALRAWYPRFSYPRKFLPAVYLEDKVSASFLERLLANCEGMLTEIEGKIVTAGNVFDARTAPAEALDWLAGWLGLVLDPLWSKLPSNQASADEDSSGAVRPDRRRLFIRQVLRLYARRGTSEGIRFALLLLLDPCLERLQGRLRAATTVDDASLRSELELQGLDYPTTTTSDAELDKLLYDYVLSSTRPSKVRVVERFMTSQGRAAAAGDPDAAAVADADAAHAFSVLIPDGLSADEQAMVRRVVELEKPAHTRYDVRVYWEGFRVGEARLGLDTALGDSGRFGPIVLGRDYLAEGFLSAFPPMDASGRAVGDRDGLPLTLH